jgi:hypothetical protein
MEATYHRLVLQRALGRRVSPRALVAIEAANLGQDSPLGLLHFPWHFDNSLFAEALAYMQTCRQEAAHATDAAVAWAAFGRLSHAAQDFYSHSNYVALWHARYPAGAVPPPEDIDGLDPALLQHPQLRSGNVYLPWEALWIVPSLREIIKLILPLDSHAWMNLDSPATGPLFPYSIEAALQRTSAEFDRTLALIGESRGAAALRTFQDQ